jgi:hypothetical protein
MRDRRPFLLSIDRGDATRHEEHGQKAEAPSIRGTGEFTMRDEGDMIAAPDPLSRHQRIARRMVKVARIGLAIAIVHVLLTAALVLTHA